MRARANYNLLFFPGFSPSPYLLASCPFPGSFRTFIHFIYTLFHPRRALTQTPRFNALVSHRSYVLNLVADGRSMRSMSLDKAGSSVIPSCACVLNDNLLFLGSRLGDSLLLTFTESSDAAHSEQVRAARASV